MRPPGLTPSRWRPSQLPLPPGLKIRLDIYGTTYWRGYSRHPRGQRIGEILLDGTAPDFIVFDTFMSAITITDLFKAGVSIRYDKSTYNQATTLVTTETITVSSLTLPGAALSFPKDTFPTPRVTHTWYSNFVLTAL